MTVSRTKSSKIPSLPTVLLLALVCIWIPGCKLLGINWKDESSINWDENTAYIYADGLMLSGGSTTLQDRRGDTASVTIEVVPIESQGYRFAYAMIGPGYPDVGTPWIETENPFTLKVSDIAQSCYITMYRGYTLERMSSFDEVDWKMHYFPSADETFVFFSLYDGSNTVHFERGFGSDESAFHGHYVYSMIDDSVRRIDSLDELQTLGEFDTGRIIMNAARFWDESQTIRYVLPEDFKPEGFEAQGEILLDFSDTEYVRSEIHRVSGDSPAVFIALKRSDPPGTGDRIGEYAFVTFPAAERLTFSPIDGNRTSIDGPTVRGNRLVYVSANGADYSEADDTPPFDINVLDLDSGTITRLGGLEAYTSIRLTWVSDTEFAAVIIGSQSDSYKRIYTLYDVDSGSSRPFDEIDIPVNTYIDPLRPTEFYTVSRTGDSITRYSIDGQVLSTHDFGTIDAVGYSYHFLETSETLLYLARQSTLWTVSTLRLMGMNSSGETWSISSYDRIREGDVTADARSTHRR